LLLKNEFSEEHHSTNVVHTNHAVSVKTAAFHGSKSQSNDVKWIEMNPSLEISYLKSVLLSPPLSSRSR